MGERLVRNEEAGGSNPPISTRKSACTGCMGGFLFSYEISKNNKYILKNDKERDIMKAIRRETP